MRVLSWNLYHGRDFPPEPALFTWRSRLCRTTERGERYAQVNRSLLREFAQVLNGLDWQVALLQEAPPRWFEELCRRSRSSGVRVLTSRNLVPRLQRALADWNPDLLASSEGGSNQILVRHPGRVLARRRLTLALTPEQRRMQWVRLELPGLPGPLCAANLHASAGAPERAAREILRAAERALAWSGSDPLVLGGDLNLRPAGAAATFDELRDRFGLAEPTAADAIDHLLARGLELFEPPRRLAPGQRELTEPDGLRIRLSDHAPVRASFRMLPPELK